jgi:CheY-like chemotaxis protein
MDGCALARQLRLDPRLRDCFIVAITGYGDSGQRHLCYAAGINVFLVKPVDDHVLQTLLNLEGEHTR